MTDMRPTIIPKSDQLNADDLIGQTRTIKVTKVLLCGEAEQPIAINFEGDTGKPYKPCKGMRRVLVNAWGPDGNKYAGRSMTLYRDEKVKFGGLEVGGIRISHMSDIDKDVTMALTASKANRKPYTVHPLKNGAAVASTSPPAPETTFTAELDDAGPNDWVGRLEDTIEFAENAETFKADYAAAANSPEMATLIESDRPRAERIKAAATAKLRELRSK